MVQSLNLMNFRPVSLVHPELGVEARCVLNTQTVVGRRAPRLGPVLAHLRRGEMGKWSVLVAPSNRLQLQ